MNTYQIKKNPFLDRRPYVYAIMWSDLNLAYLGVRHGKGCNPDDLWKTYFTSSRYVKELRAKHGEPDHLEIIDTFLTGDEAIKAEYEIILDFGLHTNPVFLNKACGRQIVVDDDVRANMIKAQSNKSAETKARLSAALKGRKRSPDECAAISAATRGKKRKPHSDKTKEKMRAAKLGKVFSDEHRANISKAQKGKKRGPMSEETKRKIGAANKGKAGQPMSDEAREHLRDAVKARWVLERALGIKRGKPVGS